MLDVTSPFFTAVRLFSAYCPTANVIGSPAAEVHVQSCPFESAISEASPNGFVVAVDRVYPG